MFSLTTVTLGDSLVLLAWFEIVTLWRIQTMSNEVIGVGRGAMCPDQRNGASQTTSRLKPLIAWLAGGSQPG